MLENNKCLVEIRVDEIQKLLAAKQVLDELHDKEIEVEQLKAENKRLTELLSGKTIETIAIDGTSEIEKLKEERNFLLNQLIVLDGEEATVQFTLKQFDEYQQLKGRNIKFEQCLEEIKEIAKGINCNGCENIDCNRCYDNFRNKINKKISEVLG